MPAGSRASPPEGSRPGFPGRDVATPLRPITGRPSLPPSSCARSPVRSPCSFPSLAGGLRVYHVPRLYPSGLGRASRPVARRLRVGNAEPHSLATCPFGPSLSASLARRTSRSLRSTSPGLTNTAHSWLPTALMLAVAVSARAYAALGDPMRLRGPAGFAPRRYQRRTLR